MKNIDRRLQRLESKLPTRALVDGHRESDAAVNFVKAYHHLAECLQVELAERGQPFVVRRVLECGTELEQLALLAKLRHSDHLLMLLMALHRQDDGSELLIWWRKAAPLTLRRLLGEDLPPAAPFEFQLPEFTGVTSDVEALRVFDRFRAKLVREQSLMRATAAQ